MQGELGNKEKIRIPRLTKLVVLTEHLVSIEYRHRRDVQHMCTNNEALPVANCKFALSSFLKKHMLINERCVNES